MFVLIVTSQSLQSPKYQMLIRDNTIESVLDFSLFESETSENSILSLATGVADVILLGFNCHGVATKLAQVSHVLVHASTCDCVASSTLPATVALAFAVAHVESSCQLQAIYLVHSQRSLIYARFLPLTGDVIAASLAVSLAYQSICKALSLVFGLEFNDATIASKNAKLFDILTTESTG